MYLKNNSSYLCGFRTKKEVLTIKPNEAVFVLDSDLISVHSLLTRISEEEYFTIKRRMEEEQKESTKTEKTETQIVEGQAEGGEQTEAQTNGEGENTKDETPSVPSQTQTEGETDVPPSHDGKEGGEQTPKTELELLEEELEKLKADWQNATRASKKATITKQIKAIQEKITKLK